MTRANRISVRLGLVAWFLFVGTAAQRQRVTIEPGLIFQGKTRKSDAISSDPALQGAGDRGRFWLVDETFKSYFFPNKLVVEKEAPDVFEGTTFKLKHRSTSRKRMPDFIGGFTTVTPWDENGVRTATLQGPRGAIKIIQAVDKITAKYIWIRSLTHNWQYGIPTTSMARADLDKILRKAIKRNNQRDRLKATQFLLEADQLELAGEWIGQLDQDFPDLKKQVKVATMDLRRLYATKLLTELRQRRRAGQHELVQARLAKFPKTDLPVAIVSDVEQLLEYYQNRKEIIDKLNSQLELLESVLEPELQEKVQPLRAEVKRELDFSSLERLQAYINLSKDKTLKPHERLAIAYSGWLLGSADAITNLPETLGLWEARPHVAAYLDSPDPLNRTRALDSLDRMEGVAPRPLAKLLAVSPPRETVTAIPGQITPMVAQTENGPVSYKVVLPPEYSPYRSYPMIVALRQANLRTDDALVWWAGTQKQPLQAQRRGYVVIAPDYLPAGAKSYESTVQSQHVVMQSVRDAFKRFSIDTDRVFLSGHGAGADATFDIAMSFPDVFAGAIPICGFVGPECSRLTTNGATLPWYVVSGQRHRDSLAHNGEVLRRISTLGKNEHLLVCEYKNRGFESYYDEIHNLFQWMESYSRDSLGKQFVASAVRPENGGLYWIEASELPGFLENQNFARNKKVKLRNVEFDFQVTNQNMIQLSKRGGAKKITLRLMDGVVDFEKPIRLTPTIGRVNRIDPKPSISDVMDDYRLYRDRNRIALQRVELK